MFVHDKKSTDELTIFDYTELTILKANMDAQIVRYLLTAACVQWLFCGLEEKIKSILCFTMNPKMKHEYY